MYRLQPSGGINVLFGNVLKGALAAHILQELRQDRLPPAITSHQLAITGSDRGSPNYV